MTRSRTISSTSMSRPYKLITVSRDSDKASKMVRALAEVLGDRHCIIHAANCERLDEIKFRVRDLQPDMLVWSPSWTSEQVESICGIARQMKADVEICGLPEDSPSQKSVDALLLRLKSNKMFVATE